MKEDSEKAALALIASNLQRLMKAHPSINTVLLLSEKSSVDQTTIHRILRRSNSPTISKLARICDALGCELWMLFSPSHELGAFEWPFELVPKSRYVCLNDICKGAVQGAMLDKIREMESLKG